MKKITLFMFVVVTLLAAMVSSCASERTNGLSHEQRHAIRARNAKDGCGQHTGYVGYGN